MMPDTIFALSSGPLPAGVAVLRISGPACRDAGRALLDALPAPQAKALAGAMQRFDFDEAQAALRGTSKDPSLP